MVLWLIILIVLVAIDQFSKLWVVSFFVAEGDTLPIIDGFFHFTYSRNPGAVFGIGGDHGFALIFFIGVFIVAIGVFGFLFLKNDFQDPKKRLYTIALTLLIAGAFGNTIDRIFQFDHRVVDFIDFRGIWPYIFNVADMCLTLGLIAFMVDTFFIEPKRRVKS
ncbi:MAG: signal peptidase II [Candidatus Izemoplasmatales bacterium]|jgi:signal peptidase II|nr:signal peptidase II [Candidatus Izemoplasmatales bacterium]